MKNRNRLLSSTALIGATFSAAMGMTAMYNPSPANAASLFTTSTITYATQAVSAAGGIVAWPGSATLTGSSSISPGAFLTLSLPSSLTWSFVPTLTTSTHVQVSGSATGQGTSAITWTLTGSSSTGDTYVFSSFTVNAPSALSTASTTGLPLTVSLGGGSTNTAAGNVSATSLNAFYATAGWTASFGAATVSINTSAAANGSLFVTSATNSSRVGQLGNVSFTSGSGKSSDGSTAYTLPTGTSSGLTVTGNFGQITRAYLANNVACQTTAGGALPANSISSASLASSSATFSTLALTSTYNLCVENQGTSLIQSTAVLGATVTPSNSVGSSAASSTTGVGTISYSGTSATLDYVTGGSSWIWYIRAVNTTASASNVFAAVTKDSDASTTYAGQVATTLAAGSSALYSIDQINTATGANLTASDRARIQFLSSGSINISSLLVNAATSVIVPVSTRGPGAL